LYAYGVADPRSKAIEDVREIFARAPKGPPPRTCPSCGAEHATLSPTCPSCDKRYDRRFARVSDRQRWALAGAALAVVIAAAALILPGVFDAKRDNNAKLARAFAARVAAEKARLTREQRPQRGRPAGLRPPSPTASASVQRAARHKLVLALEGAILADARSRVAAGRLDGPIQRVSCGPLIKNPGMHTEDEDLSKTRGRYDCVAVKREVTNGGKVVGLLGHPFVGTADFKRFTYVWCKDNKVPGERGKPLAKVPVPAVCIGAEGRPRVGDGYLSASP
jgi:hypothetical protein